MRVVEFVELLKQWFFEIRARCNETEDPKECLRVVEQLNRKIKKFEKITEMRKYWS